MTGGFDYGEYKKRETVFGVISCFFTCDYNVYSKQFRSRFTGKEKEANHYNFEQEEKRCSYYSGR